MIGVGMSAGKNLLSVEHVQIVALYEPESGTIKHLHMVTTIAGATRTPQDEVVAEAKQRARRRNPDVEALAVALSNDIDHSRGMYSIDPKTKAFVPQSREQSR